MTTDRVTLVARELGLPERGARAALELLNGGATVPFVARYRKEATGGLDEVQLRALSERHGYLLELDERRGTILETLREQGQLTPELLEKIEQCTTRSELEDLYLPFRPKRRTRAMMAREKGLEPLARRLLAQPLEGSPAREAEAYVSPDKGVGSVKDALQGARDIAAEALAETPELRATLRALYLKTALVASRRAPSWEGPSKFELYYDFREAVATIPSHRYLAVRRGEAEEVLRVDLEVDEAVALGEVKRAGRRDGRSPWAPELDLAAADALKRLLIPAVEGEVKVELKLRADGAAVDVFAQNLQALLLAAPLGMRGVVGIDPGQRTGCKVAVVDPTGRLLEHTVLYLVQGAEALERARVALRMLVVKHGAGAVAVGNGTHGREAEAFAREALKDTPSVMVVSVSEAGASVYSASDVAREEFPELDLTVRGAVSIARRLQDPLAELVKVDPKAIGVGQYQHDVFQPLLSRKLDEVVESCVNQVGVELNTASAPLLGYVAGLGPSLAKKVVQHRERHGPFASRAKLLDVAGVGPRTFEQAAGFLRVRGSANPLDKSAVHPERYPVVERMARDLGVEVGALVGNSDLAGKVRWQGYVSEDLGEPTLKDILDELRRPGRDPRAVFEAPKFREDVRTLEDLKPGMTLEGVVTNVTAFGAFVDVGVHQDGLVHVSQLADRFVRDPSEVCRPGDRLTVRVLEVDLARRRISLTAKKGAPPGQTPGAHGKGTPQGFQHTPFAKLLKR
ncbi:MAG: RNA-binding transcriptional accessory protein [Deltaproteobacteria bacterium]|nr:RNA-binding transcriptional accessory protein [Deltaproteobacteria bacterium]